MWCYISVDVSTHQKHLERYALDTISLLHHVTAPPHHTTQSQPQPLDHATIATLQRLQYELTTNGTTHWLTLLQHLVAKYHDGYRVDDFHAETIDPTALFYPYEWLKDVGFWGERGAEPDLKKTNCKSTHEPVRGPCDSRSDAAFAHPYMRVC